MAEKTPISADELLTIANQMIRDHEAYLEGMHADSVEEKAGVMVFKGEYFLNEQGLPTPKTTAVFNMFKYLAHQLSKQYTLQG
ncbi:YciN family protein [Enterovibrio paralichthyis]|uniref:YciN family protein n=1 Tax=Enterovibrio paralichthyis TaxID=2853805 RepID=UPI001C4721F2|nr:YciN family protein [Enterovibrio paralichthyis]MBV7300174.1 YciN family protein [Enterovibrio paralichthyis]